MLSIASATLSKMIYNKINLPQANWYKQELSSDGISSMLLQNDIEWNSVMWGSAVYFKLLFLTYLSCFFQISLAMYSHISLSNTQRALYNLLIQISFMAASYLLRHVLFFFFCLGFKKLQSKKRLPHPNIFIVTPQQMQLSRQSCASAFIFAMCFYNQCSLLSLFSFCSVIPATFIFSPSGRKKISSALLVSSGWPNN